MVFFTNNARIPYLLRQTLDVINTLFPQFKVVELRLAAFGLRKHLCILSNFQYVAIIGQTDWEKLEMLQRNTFKIWSLKVFKEKKHFSKIHSIWEWIWKIALKSNWIQIYINLSCVWICWTTNTVRITCLRGVGLMPFFLLCCGSFITISMARLSIFGPHSSFYTSAKRLGGIICFGTGYNLCKLFREI